MDVKTKDTKQSGRRIVIVVGGLVLTIIGFLTIPQLVRKYSNKRYKKSLESEEIDFDNMGPEIIPEEKKVGE
jgi:hypothetical protein